MLDKQPTTEILTIILVNFNVFSAMSRHVSSRALMHIHYLTDIDLEEVVDLFAIRSTQGDLNLHTTERS